MNFDNLYGDRINLIDLIDVGIRGLDDMYEYSCKPSFYKYLEYEPHKTKDETLAYLYKLIERSKSESGHYWFIMYIENQKIIGSFGLSEIDFRKGSLEIGYGLSPEYWGIGLFNETLMMVLRYLFAKLNYCRVSAKTASVNIHSIKALEKVGFIKEGVMRDYYLSTEGTRYDATLLSILRDEFYKAK